MSRRIFLDVEEALAREVRRITFHNVRTLSTTVLRNTYDPITGEVITAPVEPSFYDSSADANNVQYPYFTIRLGKTREDRFTGRELPNYGRYISVPIASTPLAYEIVLNGADGGIAAPGNDFTTTLYNVRKIQPGNFLKITNGNNVGIYIVDSITPSNSGPHTITVSSNLRLNLPRLAFETTSRVVTFLDILDLNTIKIGDNFIDSASVSFPITAVDVNNKRVTLGSTGSPNTASGGKFTRTGNVFQSADTSPIRFFILDQTKPVIKTFGNNNLDAQASDETANVSPAIPIDAYYIIRIDSKERNNHISVLNRMWEEFNPPRTGLPVIVRNANSFEQTLTSSIPSGGSTTVNVGDNSGFSIGDNVFIFDNLSPSKDLNTEGFQQPLSAKIIGRTGTTQVILDTIVPDSYTVTNGAKIVSNADFYLHMFHFVDHATKNNDGAQYWVHEFTFWVQIWVDRLGNAVNYSTIKNIADPIENLQGITVLPDL